MSLIIVKEPKLYCYPCKIRESYSANSKKLPAGQGEVSTILNDLHLLGRSATGTDSLPSAFAKNSESVI